MDEETSFMKFLQDPTRENFLRIRSEVVAHEDYQPYSTDLDEASQLLEEEKWAEFIDAGRNMIPNHLLTPRFHMMRSFALHKMGVKEDSEIESVMYACCIQGIFSTGDGTENSPWLVLRTGDEYDVLQELELQLVRQSLRAITIVAIVSLVLF